MARRAYTHWSEEEVAILSDKSLTALEAHAKLPRRTISQVRSWRSRMRYRQGVGVDPDAAQHVPTARVPWTQAQMDLVAALRSFNVPWMRIGLHFNKDWVTIYQKFTRMWGGVNPVPPADAVERALAAGAAELAETMKPQRVNREWTAAEKKEAVRLAGVGMTMRELAKKYGRSEASVKSLVNRVLRERERKRG
jgi:hypothetical protein